VVRWRCIDPEVTVTLAVRIAFVHFPGRLARLEAARAGEGPTEFLFGAVELERQGHEVTHHEVDPAAPAGRLARRLVDHQAGRRRLPPHAAAAVLSGTKRLLPALRQADVVVATTTGTAVALATWRRVGRLETPLVGIVAGLLNDPWGRARRATTLPLLRRMHAMLYGPGEAPGLEALDAQLAGRVHVNRFGVDIAFWTPGGTASGGVLAIGNDGHRDWATLVAAAPAIEAEVTVLTRHVAPADLPGNVRWRPADWHERLLSDTDVRDAFRSAAVVVVPVKDVPQPSGQSVTLQASACGRPVVLTRTRGLWDPEALRDGENVLLVPPGDSEALAAAVGRVVGDPAAAAALGRAARETVEATASVEGYAARLLEICEAARARP
jgi:glycosyltransferase involved in cell wall biosynthesis